MRVTFLHITPKLVDFCSIDFDEKEAQNLEQALLEEDARCLDDFYGKARIILREAGLEDTQIETKTQTTTLSVARAIRDEMRNGGYGTLVVGRKGGHKASFMGSVSNKLMQTMTDCALWLTV